nr:MAG TPA: hypothetical protein [Caudoviricetes sp.]
MFTVIFSSTLRPKNSPPDCFLYGLFTGFQIPFCNFIFNQKRYYPQIRIISFPWS